MVIADWKKGKLIPIYQEKETFSLGSLQKVDNKIVKDWHSFFIKNQEKYCLSMYYQVKKNRISGITFFKGQSLSYPCPLEKEEVKYYHSIGKRK